MCNYCTLLLQYWYSTCTILFQQYLPPPHDYVTTFPPVKSLSLHIIMSLFKRKDYSYKSHHTFLEGNEKSFSTVLPKQYCKSLSPSPQKRQLKSVSDFSKHGEELSIPTYSTVLKGTAHQKSDVGSSIGSEKSYI